MTENLLGLTLAEALQLAPAPKIVKTSPTRPRSPLPEGDEHWRVVRVDADAWIVAPALPLPS